MYTLDQGMVAQEGRSGAPVDGDILSYTAYNVFVRVR